MTLTNSQAADRRPGRGNRLWGFFGSSATGLLPPWLDPNKFLRDPVLAPWIVAVMCAFLFVETGLLVGFFLPGDTLLFTAGLLVATGTIHVNILVVAAAAFAAAFAGDQVGYLIGRKAGPAVFRRPKSRLLKSEYVDERLRCRCQVRRLIEPWQLSRLPAAIVRRFKFRFYPEGMARLLRTYGHVDEEFGLLR